MNYQIKKLDLSMIEDYLYFFDHVAFSDGSDWVGCYCVWYHWNEEHEHELSKYNQEDKSCYNRELAIKLINEGVLQGYLCYLDDKVVGWCNTNDKSKYDRLSRQNRPELWEETYNEKVKAIVCYTIAPNMRRKGIATQLLQKLCEDAAMDGYDYVEAYPCTGSFNERSYHGALSMYEKQGFTVYKDLGDEVMVRKYLT